MSERGLDFFVMTLARSLGMTRRRLLAEMDFQELNMWQAYFQEANRPPSRKEKPEVLQAQLKNVFEARNLVKRKKK